MKPHKKYLFLFLIDIITINLAFYQAFFLRFDGIIPPVYRENWFYPAAVLTLIRILCFVIFDLYRSLWRYSSLPEMVQIFKAVFVSSVLFFILNSSIYMRFPIPRSVIIIDFGLALMLVGGFRLLARLRREFHYIRLNKAAKRVLVVGAGQAGAQVIQEMLREHKNIYRPVAVVDDNPAKLHFRLHGIPVAGNTQQLTRVVERYKANEILIAIPSAPKGRLREIVKQAKQTGLPVRILPGLLEIVNGKISFLQQTREVRIEDLLGRKPVRINLCDAAGYLAGERILITGAGGSIGGELCRQVSTFKPAVLLLLGRGENSIYEIDRELATTHPNICRKALIADIRDRNKMEQVFRLYRPTVVFHAAAHKHVPLMEKAPDEAVKNNVFGVKNLVELADQYAVKRFVLISTDKAVNPTSVMGASKRLAEMIVQHMATRSKTKYCSVRFGNVLGSRGSIIPLFKKQIAAGGPVTVTHPEMRRYFMTIPEAVSLVIQAGAMGKKGEIFVLDMGEPVRIVDLAHDLIRLSGFEPEKDIKIKYCGIRPGEKLFEEILTIEEGSMATKHKQIYIGKPHPIDEEKFRKHLDDLEKWVVTADHGKVVEILQEMIPGYQPSKVWSKEMIRKSEEF